MCPTISKCPNRTPRGPFDGCDLSAVSGGKRRFQASELGGADSESDEVETPRRSGLIMVWGPNEDGGDGGEDSALTASLSILGLLALAIVHF